MKEKTIKILFITLIAISFIGGSLGYFRPTIIGRGKHNNVVSANLEVTFNDVEILTLKNNKPIYEDDYKYKADYIDFSITGQNNTIEGCYTLYISVKEMTPNLKSEYFKWILYDLNKEQIYLEGDFSSYNNEDLKISNLMELKITTNDSYRLYIFLANDEEVNQTSLLNSSFSATVKGVSNDVCPPTLTEKILADNTPQSDAGISFKTTSASDGTVGLYYTSDTTKTENGKVVYYYRGAVTNNYLVFGNYCFRIVRTVEDGSVRLRYGGEATQSGETYTCPQTGTTVSIGEEEIHESAGAGFYYLEYKESLIKIGVENWYRDNIAPNTSLANLVEDTPYCSDGTYEQVLAFETDFGSTYDDYYGAYNRLSNNSLTPQYKCEDASDGYTVAKGDLTYPVGLLTADEVAYAGAQINGTDSNYLSIGADYWTMSVAQYLQSVETVYWFTVNSNAGLSLRNALNTIHLVPAISLKNKATVLKGTGAYNDPYVINTD